MKINLMRSIVCTARPVGAICRSLLRMMPESTVVPILCGPLKGYKWLLHSGVGAYWVGTYEPETEKLLSALITPGMVCYDCGANVGHYTLLFSKLVGPAGRVIAFEPFPRNVNFLRKHISLNDCSNVIVEEVALTDRDGLGRMSQSGPEARLDSEGEFEVLCKRIDSLNLPPPELMKVDIEGAEIEMLAGAESVLRKHRPAIVMALHIQRDLAKKSEDWLRSLGYVVTWSPHSYEFLAVHSGIPPSVASEA